MKVTRRPAQNAKPEEPSVQPLAKPTPAARNLMARRDRALAILARLDNKTCVELGRRARGAPRDGYPSTTGGEGVSNSEVSRPTEVSAIAAIESTWADPVGDAIAEIFTTMAEALGLLLVIDDQRGYVLAVGKEGRASSLTSCSCCARDVLCQPGDRLRAGFCSACYSAWIRASRPERAEFIRDRRAALTEVA